jgi:hypothetical protein
MQLAKAAQPKGLVDAATPGASANAKPITPEQP